MKPAAPALRATGPLRAMLVAALVVPALLFAVGACESRTLRYREAEQKVRQQSVLLYEHAQQVMQGQELVLEQVNQRLQGLSWDEIRSSRPLWEDLRRLVGQVSQVDAIFVLDRDGRGALTTRTFPSPPVDFSDRDYFVAQRNQDTGTYLSSAYIGKISHRRIFNLSVRRDAPDGVFDGVVGLSVFIEYFEHFYGLAAL